MEDIRRGESSLASFLACIEESISEREGKQFMNRKVKLDMYKREVKFKSSGALIKECPKIIYALYVKHYVYRKHLNFAYELHAAFARGL